MSYVPPATAIAFADHDCIASGPIAEVAAAVKARADLNDGATILVFEPETSRPVELDLRGSIDDVLARLPRPSDDPAVTDVPAEPRKPGRPKLGVVPREVTLLPRHWEWLARQPGGASVTLRKLVEEARKRSEEPDRIRAAQDSTYRFMTAIAGNQPGFEEASRALFAADRDAFEAHTEAWPADVRSHARRLAAPALGA